MKMKLSDLTSFQQRVLSSCVIVPYFIVSIYWGNIPFFILMALLLSVSFDEWMKMAFKSETPKKLASLGGIYLAVGLGSFFFLRQMPVEQADFLTLSLIFMIWACDTGAYFSGKLIGGKKLCPAISPGKTWAGMIGGLTVAALIAIVCQYFFGFYGSFGLALLLGVIIASVGQIGDLTISMLKRKVGVKDTGTLIPGHGGILDRIDSLLLAAPVYLVLVFILNRGFWPS